MTTTKERFAEAKAKMRAAQEEARVVARDAFKDGAAELFAAHPKLDSIGWKQYTPYFNDGDACVFAAHIDEPDINGGASYDNPTIHATHYAPTGEFDTVPSFGGRTEQREKYARVPNPAYDPELGAAYEATREFLGSFDSSDYLELFGDHRRVVLHRDGALTVDEYEHD